MVAVVICAMVSRSQGAYGHTHVEMITISITPWPFRHTPKYQLLYNKATKQTNIQTNSRNNALGSSILCEHIVKIVLSSVPGSPLGGDRVPYTVTLSFTQSLFILLPFKVCSLFKLSFCDFFFLAASWRVIFRWWLSGHK